MYKRQVLGKRLVGDFLKHQLPDDLCRDFLKEYDLTLSLIHICIAGTALPICTKQSGPALDHDYRVGRNCDCEPKYHERFLQAAGYSA